MTGIEREEWERLTEGAPRRILELIVDRHPREALYILREMDLKRNLHLKWRPLKEAKGGGMARRAKAGGREE